MSTSIQRLVSSALACAGMLGCQSAGKDAASDARQDQAKEAAGSVTTPPRPAAEPIIATTPQSNPATAKDAAPPKSTGGQAAQGSAAGTAGTAGTAAAAAAARADSIRQAQDRAEAQRLAALDSVKRAEAARAGAKTEATVPRGEAVAPGGAALAAQGKIPYEENCRKCHGVRGVPPKTMKEKFPKIVTFDAEFFGKRTDDSVVTVLTKGKSEDMKSFKDNLSHSQMVAVAAYIRSFGQKQE